MIRIDLVALVRNALTASNSKWVSVDYRQILSVNRFGFAEDVVGTVVELNDGYQWMTVVYRTDGLADVGDGFKVEPVDMALLKRVVHIKHGMEDCKGTFNDLLDVMIDRLAHHQFSAEIVTPIENLNARKPAILRFKNEKGQLSIYRMESSCRAVAKHNLEARKSGKVKSSFWQKLRLRWNRKSECTY